MIGGRTCVRLDWAAESQNPPGSAYRGSYWVAPDLGFALVRAVSDRRPSPAMAWKVVSELDHDGFVGVDGVWLPAEVKFRRFAYYDAGDVYELTQDLSATFSNWRRNAPDTRPTPLAFPDGTRVFDRRKPDDAR